MATEVNVTKFTGDKIRLFQVFSLAGLALVALLNAVTSGKFLTFLGVLVIGALMFFSLVPVYLALLRADNDPLPRTGLVALRAAEAAGIAGVAAVVLCLFLALATLITGANRAFFGMVFDLLLLQAISGAGISIGVGLTNLLRNGNVQLEAPPPVQTAAPQQPHQQPPQQYQQPPGGYPPQGHQ